VVEVQLMKRENRRFTAEEYLAFERGSRFKHEFINGRIYKMGEWSTIGGTPADHNAIVSAVFTSLLHQTKKCDRDIYSSLDVAPSLIPQGFDSPDIVVTCARQLEGDDGSDASCNPQLIAEVLSDSTEQYDRGRKFEHYRQIESLREYLLISQDRAHVELFARDATAVWELREATGLDAAIELPAIGCQLALADVYAKVSWATS
jgi:Uma2 family endonuclease